MIDPAEVHPGDWLVFVDNLFNQTFIRPAALAPFYYNQIILVRSVVGNLVESLDPLTLVYKGSYAIDRFERYSDVS